MSAYVVEPGHIRELAAFSVSRRNGSRAVEPKYLPVSDGLKQQLAAGALNDAAIATIYAGVLYSENLRSVFSRYPDCGSIADLPGLIEKPESITIEPRDMENRQVHDAVQLLKMCDCLEYQSCESKDYEETDAYKILQRIRRAAIKQLPGYDSARWEWAE